MSALLWWSGVAFGSNFTGYGRNANYEDAQAAPYNSEANRGVRYTDVLWPRSSFAGQAGNSNGPLESVHQLWEFNVPVDGISVRKRFTGVARDSAGNPLGGATVQLFNTATGLLVDTQTADGSGNYTVTDPNNVACFVVAYLAGSPDVAGTTVNTLTGV